MARKLKSYLTSIGFFDLAVAAPSMKAALQAWGLDRNAFQQGFARETNDPAIVAATGAKPGIVLRRPVGSKIAFAENAALSGDMALGAKARLPAVANKPKPKKPAKKTAPAKVISFAQEKARRERERAGKDAAREKRAHAVDKAEADVAKARQQHEDTMAQIEAMRHKADRRASLEHKRWETLRKKLDAAVDRARQQ